MCVVRGVCGVGTGLVCSACCMVPGVLGVVWVRAEHSVVRGVSALWCVLSGLWCIVSAVRRAVYSVCP